MLVDFESHGNLAYRCENFLILVILIFIIGVRWITPAVILNITLIRIELSLHVIYQAGLKGVDAVCRVEDAVRRMMQNGGGCRMQRNRRM